MSPVLSLVLGRVACDAADVLGLLEDDSDGEERVKVMGVAVRVSCSCGWSLDFPFPALFFLPYGADHEQHKVGEDSLLPVWVDDATDRHAFVQVGPPACCKGW
jgi:hypothetical protein